MATITTTTKKDTYFFKKEKKRKWKRIWTFNITVILITNLDFFLLSLFVVVMRGYSFRFLSIKLTFFTTRINTTLIKLFILNDRFSLKTLVLLDLLLHIILIILLLLLLPLLFNLICWYINFRHLFKWILVFKCFRSVSCLVNFALNSQILHLM